VSGPVTEDIMVFGQAPCSRGRYRRRNVAYLGLLPPPEAGVADITDIYVAKYGPLRANTKIFIVTRQQKNGWEGPDKETSAVVPGEAESPQSAVPSAQASPQSTLPSPQPALNVSIPVTEMGQQALPKPASSSSPHMHTGGTRDAHWILQPPPPHSLESKEPAPQAGKASESVSDGGGGGGGPGAE
jgi:hypothetical protein